MMMRSEELELFNVKFLKTMEKFRCLYDTGHKDYGNKARMDMAWEKFAEEVGDKHPETTKVRWRHMRGSLLRYVKSKSIPGNRNKKPYYLAKHMEFILPFVKPKTTRNPQFDDASDYDDVDYGSNGIIIQDYDVATSEGDLTTPQISFIKNEVEVEPEVIAIDSMDGGVGEEEKDYSIRHGSNFRKRRFESQESRELSRELREVGALPGPTRAFTENESFYEEKRLKNDNEYPDNEDQEMVEGSTVKGSIRGNAINIIRNRDTRELNGTFNDFQEIDYVRDSQIYNRTSRYNRSALKNLRNQKDDGNQRDGRLQQNQRDVQNSNLHDGLHRRDQNMYRAYPEYPSIFAPEISHELDAGSECQADLLFFQSILPDMQLLTMRQKRKVKIGLMNLIDQAISESFSATQTIEPATGQAGENANDGK